MCIAILGSGVANWMWTLAHKHIAVAAVVVVCVAIFVDVKANTSPLSFFSHPFVFPCSQIVWFSSMLFNFHTNGILSISTKKKKKQNRTKFNRIAIKKKNQRNIINFIFKYYYVVFSLRNVYICIYVCCGARQTSYALSSSFTWSPFSWSFATSFTPRCSASVMSVKAMSDWFPSMIAFVVGTRCYYIKCQIYVS